jgi:hypothetical protein
VTQTLSGLGGGEHQRHTLEQFAAAAAGQMLVDSPRSLVGVPPTGDRPRTATSQTRAGLRIHVCHRGSVLVDHAQAQQKQAKIAYSRKHAAKVNLVAGLSPSAALSSDFA